MARDLILIFDFGSQFTQLIARRVRELNVFCQLVRHDLPVERVRELNPKGIILSGGPFSVYEEKAPKCDPRIYDLGIPILGICYGLQLFCQHIGAKVLPAHSREFGRALLKISQPRALLEGVPESSTVWMSHGDQVEPGTDEFDCFASTDTCPWAAVQHKKQPFFGIQFHPEVHHTEFGSTILKNFLLNICVCDGSWRMDTFVDAAVASIRARVGKSRVICGLSGGVDSSVVAALLFRAIGPQLACIFVDNGLLRTGEADAVKKTFRDWYKADLHVVDASERFLTALANVTDPQAKRKAIGFHFVEVFKVEAMNITDAHFLAQGTLYPDVIESGGSIDGTSATIKTHHNVGGLPKELGFELIEPLRDLFKDEVRKLGVELGLPEDLVWRHPFPGPGLAVRCLGAITKPRLDILRQADRIFLQELKASGWYKKTAQAFAVLLPIQSVGVMGDGRTYESVIALRAVQTEDYMTADWAHLPHDFLAKVSTRIINEVRGVNRVVYDISSKPPATIEWE